MSDSIQEKLIGKRIGLDIDGVCCCFVCGVKARAKTMGYDFPSCQTTSYWNIHDKFAEVMDGVWKDEQFWLELKPLIPNVPFVPDSYITHRQVPSEITAKWLADHNFPKAEVITVKETAHKLDVIKERKIDIFVDDFYQTVKHLRDNGVNAILYKASYQSGHYDECKDLPTIKDLSQIVNYI